MPQILDRFNCIEVLERSFPSSNFILAGDFNARVGSNNEIFLKALGMDDEASIPYWCTLSRRSKDHNVAGAELAKLCTLFSQCWLNGLTEFPEADKFTHITCNGSSVIDYILVSTTIIDKVSDFAVRDALGNDHLRIIAKVRLAIPIENLKTNSNHDLIAPTKILWNNYTHQKFLSAQQIGSAVSGSGDDHHP
ncbi:hypothetical protein JRQ81_019485 [Phrynocephalus forsythii]|uniref:Endonuclease/exonuclease/phosphatase domain-containing protein n=1 Tax=Phrynocephalus forsythii TaxID=171643 RepID=A0A9Q1AY12_9SAUR|nr:hypothetical protein JRQ81_019485 [Phrynocephalus forsythii]